MDQAGKLARLGQMHDAGRLIELDFAIKPVVRYGGDRPRHEKLHAIIAAGDARYAKTLRGFCAHAPWFHAIDLEEQTPSEPFWLNLAIPVADAVSICCYLIERNPARYVEIGSGYSTLFARKVIRDHGLRTKIISIDPYPRTEVDAVCDEVIRQPLEDADLSLFASLTPDDLVFCDNSHRAFQNSDVTVFFLDILPMLADGPLVGVHDIFLPYDYPERWLDRYYNEQYLLACWLLAGTRLDIELPLFHVTMTPHLFAELDPIWGGAGFDRTVRKGGAFWFRTLSQDGPLVGA